VLVERGLCCIIIVFGCCSLFRCHTVIMMVESLPSSLGLAYKGKLEHASLDDFVHTNASALRSELTSSFGIDAARVVDLDLSYDEDDSEDEGEIMLLAMILLQLHGVKLPAGYPDPSSHTYDPDNDSLSAHNKKKRQRTSPDQLAILEQIFQTDKMPSQQTRVQLADQLGMSSRRVQIWFQNKRAKVKRGVSKSSEISPILESPTDSSRDGFASLSSSSTSISEPPSPLVPDSVPSSLASSSTSLSMSMSMSMALSSMEASFSSPPGSPTAAVVPCSPSHPSLLSSFSSNPLASQQILLHNELSAF